MKAAVYHGRTDLRIEDVPEPEAGPGEVKVKVAANGICGSDLHEYYAGPLFVPVEPHPLTGAKLPLIFGHEFAGEVVDVGDGVDDLSPGDLVAVEPIVNCGSCPPCRTGIYNLCTSLAFHGLMTAGGGLAEYTVVNRRMAHRLPEGVSAQQGALVEPMAVAYHAVRRGRLEPGQAAVVYGAGPIGIGTYLSLRATGVDDVVVVEPSPARREAIKGLGATEILDPSADDVVQAVLDRTGGLGADASFDAAGVQASFSSAVASTGRHGTIVLVAIFEAPVTFSPNELLFTEAAIVSSLAYCGDDFPTVIDFMAAGKYPSHGWVKTIPLDRLVEDGFEALHKQAAMKVLVDVQG